ncbi:MAG: DegV family protein [Candidatus Kariarchaeaceae archaeon]|jgi:DegV family protein with EDD domain
MVKIVTDSASDIPERLTKDLEITFVPARILFGRKAYRDKIDLDQIEFYSKLQTSRYHPTTTQASPLDFYKAFREIEKSGQDILCITLPRSLSALIVSAEIAAKYIKDVNIQVISSGGVSAFQGVQVIQAAQMAKLGYGSEEIISKLEEVRSNTRLYAVASTLDYLKRGGRITTARYRLGTLTRTLPILTVKDEEVLSDDKQLLGNMDKALDKVVASLKEDFNPDTPLFGILLHSQNLTGASILSQKLLTGFKFANLITSPIGATIGANIGPGALGVAVAPSFSLLEI